MRYTGHFEGCADARPLANPKPFSCSSDWLAMPFRPWCGMVGISVSHAYELAKEGKLKITKLGRKSVIVRDESDRFLREGAR